MKISLFFVFPKKIGHLILLLLVLCMQCVLAGDIPANFVRIHYNRDAADYTGWGLHVWGADVDLSESVTWSNPMLASGSDYFGVYFDVPVRIGAKEVQFILHRGDEKNSRSDKKFAIPAGREVWVLQSDSAIYFSPPATVGRSLKSVPQIERSNTEATAENKKEDRQRLLLYIKLQAQLDARIKSDDKNHERSQAELAKLRAETALLQEKADKLIQLSASTPAPISLPHGIPSASSVKASAKPAKKPTQLPKVKVIVPPLIIASRPAVLLTEDNPTAEEDQSVWVVGAIISLLVIFLLFMLYRLQKFRHIVQTQQTFLANTQLILQQDMDERKHAQEKIEALSNRDALTSLPNRTAFLETVAFAINRASRTNKKLAVIFIDLDRFKRINDTISREAGDQILQTIAERIKSLLRPVDLLSRLSADEFVVLLDEQQDLQYAGIFTQRILDIISEPCNIHDQLFHITASAGISLYPTDARTGIALLKHADIAMFRAKEVGKNSYQYFNERMNSHLTEKLKLETSLREALTRDEFEVYFQPVIEQASGRISGMEALVRWRHPEQGLVSPALFIPIAEETGIIVDIGKQILRKSCFATRQLLDLGHDLVVAVNLSPAQFSADNLVSDIRATLIETGLAANKLELEITEGMLMQDPTESINILNKIKALGIHISIDDFGTGYSSLAYLKRFPIDTLKIDQSFIRDIPHSTDDIAITEAVIALAASLRLRVVAEGVETIEQLNFLRAHKCSHLQGYYFSRPVPAAEFIHLLNAKPSWS